MSADIGGARSRAPVLLTYRTLGLGDLLTAIPALRALRRAFPAHRHVHASPAATAPLVGLLDAVDDHLPTGELADVALPGTAVDVAVNLHGRGPQSHRVLRSCRPRRLIAFAHPAADHDGPRWRGEEHEVHRWCRLLQEEGIAADPTDLHLAVPEGPVHASAPGCTIIHPGAASQARRWPAGRFAAVAARERQRGRAVLVTGSPDERGLAEEVAAAAGLDEDAVLAGRTDLLALARTVAVADRILCGDTGVAHLATAVRTPSVVLFGPTPPSQWGPPAALAGSHVVLWTGEPGDPHAEETHPGLLAIGVEEVLDALDGLPSLSRPG